MQDEFVLWSAWRDHGDLSAKQELLRRFESCARIVAARQYRQRQHDEAGFDEYLQYAWQGLMEAFDRFEPARGITFRAYCGHRIRGAIVDGMAHLSERQSFITARREAWAERRESLACIDSDEQADAIDELTGAPLLEFLATVSIGLAMGALLSEGTEELVPGDEAHDTVYRSVEIKQLRGRLVSSIEQLPAHERKVIHRHYLQQQRFEQIADAMQLSRGRVSQIHRQALLRLRELLLHWPRCNVLA